MAIGKYKPLTLTPINLSLTEGTPIPAPLDSPPHTPRPPTPGKGPLSSHPTPKSPVFPHNESTNGKFHDGEDQLHPSRTSDAASSTLSPTSPHRRPSSVRKFLGLRTLSSSDSLKSDRPGSPATINSQTPTLTRRKSSSWFGKKKNIGTVPEGTEIVRPSSSARTVSQPAQPPKKKGPPPPALPELKSFGVSEDSLSLGADDMFKNIK
ncbi:hypothetical protein FB567DRAFT_341638 [Paraphoma chrysanthemicola]|uniref:Uncharacterized protein n=1 Tax=Paraphoma chrysanthemicola TaxID=798071 RepID=A0A8K0R7F7_9PLEO|nr:hypothetical protein FB567DRAFT_341638 [Paraphoma chrysanthemicola]